MIKKLLTLNLSSDPIFLLLLLLLSTRAYGAWDQKTLEQKVVITAPSSGAKLEFFKAAGAELFAVAANYQGGPLPGEKSIVIKLTPPATGRVHASYFQGTTRLGPYQTAPVWVGSLGQVPGMTEYALWQEKDGTWGAIIALVGGGLRTNLQGSGNDMLAISDSLDKNFTPSRVPLFAMGWGKDPYQLTEDLYAYGFKIMKDIDPKNVIGKMRKDKKFPEIWGYVGWCSWNAYYRYVDQQDLINNAASFKKANFPVRWILIDDCWSTVNKQTMMPWSQGHLYLTGMEADPKKYPGGMKRTTEILKKDYGVTWVGVWHTFNGYWNGIQIDSEIGKQMKDYLMPVSEKVAVPDPRSDNGFHFWDAWYKFLKDSGVDFVKVDNQGTLPLMTRDKLAVINVTGQAHKNLEAAAEKYFDSNVMNCMNENVETIYQWEKTNLGRSSVDYNPLTYTNPRSNCVLNVFNSLWYTQVSWPDYDMWMTHDKHVEYYAVEHAVSGGPVYSSDKPGREKFEYLWPMIFSDGKVIRADEPAMPLKKYLLVNPYFDQKPLAAFAHTGEAGMLAAWNVDKYFRPIKDELSPGDVEGIKGERFAVYEQFSKKLLVLNKNEKFPVQLKGWDVKLYSVVPVKDGFAPIGLLNKYISPAAVKGISQGQGKAMVKLAEPGTFGAYCERKPATVKANGSQISDKNISFENGLLKVEIPSGKNAVELEIIW